MTNASAAQAREPVDTKAWMRAIDAGDAAAIRSLLATGAEINSVAEAGETALMRAASKGNLEVVQLLLEAGGDVHARSENGFTPLFMAVFFGHVGVVRALLAAGSKVDAPIPRNMNAEKWAELWGTADMVELLKNADTVRAQEPASKDVTTGREQTDALPPLFPVNGHFRTVVPLSEIERAQRAEVSAPLEKPINAGIGPKENGRDEVRPSTQGQKDDEQSEATLIRARTERISPSRSWSISHPRRGQQTWPGMVIAITLSMIAGLAAGVYLIGSKQKNLHISRPTEGDMTVAGAGTKALSSPSGSSSPDTPSLRPTAQPSDLNTTVNHDPVTPSETAVIAPSEAEAKDREMSRDQSVSQPAPGAKTVATMRSPADKPQGRQARTTGASNGKSDHAMDDTGDGSSATRLAQRETTPARRTKLTEKSLSNTGLSGHSIPVSSPPSSAQSGKVIQWP